MNTRGGIVIAGAGGFTQYAIFGAIVKGGLILLFQKAPGDGVAENTVAIRLRLIAAIFDALSRHADRLMIIAGHTEQPVGGQQIGLDGFKFRRRSGAGHA